MTIGNKLKKRIIDYIFKPIETKKNSSIEFMRIFSMLCIVLFHFTDHGRVILGHDLNFNLNWLTMAFARLGGGVGNCIFILITGYLLVLKKFTFKRVIFLWLEVLFYSFITALFLYLIGEKIPKIDKILFPVVNNTYWFISSYIILLFLSPVLNRLLISTTKKYIFIYFLLIGTVWSILPTFFYQNWMRGINNLEIFILLYCIGGYIKLNPIKERKEIFILSLLSILAIFLSEIFIKIYEIKLPVDFYAFSIEKTPIIISSTLLFISFLNIKFRLSKFCYSVSESVFAVYLIHMGHAGYFIYYDLFNNENIVYSHLFIPWLIISWLTIFFICILIDKLRKIIVSTPLVEFFKNQIINKVIIYLDQKLNPETEKLTV